MDLLQYYFRKSDKNDLKGIIEDCEEQFRLGASQGKTEEEICCKLGHPKNIYRYYIGEPIVPEDNPRLPGDDYDDSYQEYDDFGPGTVSSRYDLPEQPDDYGRPGRHRRSVPAPSRPLKRRIVPRTGPGNGAVISIGMTGQTIRPKPLPVLF